MPTLTSSIVAAAGAVTLAAGLSLVTPVAVQSQPNTVGPDKPVLVINPSSRPVPVVDVGVASTEPFQATADIDDSFNVPAGKLLVIEFISGRVDLNTTCPAGAVDVLTDAGDGYATHFFNLTPIVASASSKIQSVSTATRLYARGAVSIGHEGFGGGCTVNGRLTFSGHLEDLP